MVHHHHHHKHVVFGVERNIDVPVDQFPSLERQVELEAPMTADNCQHGWFESTFTGTKKKQPKTIHLHYRYFLPSTSTPKGVAIFAHGLQNHSGCAYIMPESQDKRNMAAITSELLQRDFAIYAFDFIGHGYSEGKRHVMPSAEVLIDDYLKFVALVVEKHPNNVPLFFMGESLGGNLSLHVARYLQDHPDQHPPNLNFMGMVLIAPAIYPTNIYLPMQLLLKTIVTPFVPSWRPPSIIPSPVGIHNLWRDPERIAIGSKPNGIEALPSQQPPYLSLLTLCVLMRRVRDTTIPGLGRVPFFVAHGAKDVAIPMVGSEWLVEQAIQAGLSPEDCTLQIYPDALHDLLSEPEAEEMMTFVADWMCQRIDKKKEQQSLAL